MLCPRRVDSRCRRRSAPGTPEAPRYARRSRCRPAGAARRARHRAPHVASVGQGVDDEWKGRRRPSSHAHHERRTRSVRRGVAPSAVWRRPRAATKRPAGRVAGTRDRVIPATVSAGAGRIGAMTQRRHLRRGPAEPAISKNRPSSGARRVRELKHLRGDARARTPSFRRGRPPSAGRRRGRAASSPSRFSSPLLDLPRQPGCTWDSFEPPRGRGSAACSKHLARLARRGCGRFEWSVLEWNRTRSASTSAGATG